MERMLLATGALSDNATITGPTGAGDLSIDNLKQQSLQEVYRVLGSACVLDIDLTTAQAFNLVGLMGHNGSESGTVRVTASDTLGGATYDSGTLPLVTGPKQFDKSLFLLFLGAPITYRYCRIEITDPAAAYIELGRVYVSNAFQPSYNMVYGFQQGFIDPSEKYRTTSGDRVPRKQKKWRFADWNLEDLTEDEVFSELYPLDKLVGTTQDVLFVPKPDDISHLQFTAIYGTIEAMNPNVATSFDRFSRQFRVEELLP
ncbi:hypothetical protein K3G63_04725 [Hymenobacter sp. HSC-4F20]|uniref:hypothetical protein n=1 Tax=Hymenobacter sp. HSC-4F20 TaxID=2864135 RepID=UPI001C738C67|nr:hypothetical protein [Hymenobacter sp. HSC-4F20]MBX0289728.1 hypothetical protein [Hymenobacter sp. HSC-4F20]